MPDTLLLSQSTGVDFDSLSTSRFLPMGTGAHLSRSNSFAEIQNRFQTAGTFRNLHVVVPTNNRTTSVTVATAVGGVAGAQAVTIPATTTGIFEDTSNTDTVTAGQDWGYIVTKTTASAGTEAVATEVSVVYTTGVLTSRPSLPMPGGDLTSFGTTRYFSIMGYGGTSTISSTTESEVTFYTPCAGEYRNGHLRVSANTCNGSTVVTFRKNAAGTALTFTVPATTTGTFEDTTNSVSVAIGDLVAWEYAAAGSSGSVTKRLHSVDFTSAGDEWFTGAYGAGTGNSVTLPVSATRYARVGGENAVESTESVVQTYARLNLTATGIGIKVGSTNHGACTMTFRKAGADTALTVNIPANTAGWHVATGGTVELTPSDLQSLKLVHGGASNQMTYRQVYVLYQGAGRSYIWAAGLDGAAHTITESSTFAVWANHIRFNDAEIDFKEVALTNAEIKALRATPKELVAAPGAGKLLEFVSLMLLLDYGGTNVFTETADNLQVKYENGSGPAASETIETTGFIDQSADTWIEAKPATSAAKTKAATENKALVLHNTGDGEIAGNAANNNLMRALVAYRIWETGW